MNDRVAKRGRPRLMTPPKLSCLRRTPEANAGGLMSDNTFWHKDVDSLTNLSTHRSAQNTNQLHKERNPRERENWKTYNGINLTKANKRMIIENEWIDDCIINAAQVLLQKKYPLIKGLQNVLLCDIDLNQQMDWNQIIKDEEEIKQLIDFRKNTIKSIEELNVKLIDISTEAEQKKTEDSLAENQKKLKETEEMLTKLKKNETKVNGLQPVEKDSKFVQILLDNNNRNHWICVSNVKTKRFKTVRVYDCDHKRIGQSIRNYSLATRAALKRIYSDCENIRIELPFVLQPIDNCSAGVYSIAFAQALCAGKDPAQILFTNDHRLMRTHLLMCLEKGSIDQFPTGRDSKLFNNLIKRQNKN